MNPQDYSENHNRVQASNPGKSNFINNVFYLVIGAITGASLETLISNFLDRDFSLETNLAVLLVAIVIIISSTLIFLSRIEDQVKNQTADVASEVRTIAQETYIRTNKATEKLVTTARQIDDIALRMETATMTARYVPSGLSFPDDPGYLESLNKIRGAQKSILIIGDFSPEWMPLRPPARRNQYLIEIEKRLKDAIEDRNINGFNYTRIIQREKHIVRNVLKNDNQLSEQDMRFDEQAFVHSYEAQKIYNDFKGGESGVQVEIRLSEPIPNCPSILLIDSEYMLFTIPIQTDYNLDSRYIGTDGVLIFQDLADGKAFAERFEEIIRKAIIESERVKVEKPSEQLTEKYKRDSA